MFFPNDKMVQSSDYEINVIPECAAVIFAMQRLN